jgi:hypothetical protein
LALCRPKLTLRAEFQLSFVSVRTNAAIVMMRMIVKYRVNLRGVQTQAICRKRGNRTRAGGLSRRCDGNSPKMGSCEWYCEEESILVSECIE